MIRAIKLRCQLLLYQYKNIPVWCLMQERLTVSKQVNYHPEPSAEQPAEQTDQVCTCEQHINICICTSNLMICILIRALNRGGLKPDMVVCLSLKPIWVD